MTPIESLELSTRTTKALQVAGVETIEDFIKLEKATVLSWKGIGNRSWCEIRDTQKYLLRPTPDDRLRSLSIVVSELNQKLNQFDGRVIPLVRGGQVYIAKLLS